MIIQISHMNIPPLLPYPIMWPHPRMVPFIAYCVHPKKKSAKHSDLKKLERLVFMVKFSHIEI